MALNGLFCADVPLRNYSLTHSLAMALVMSAAAATAKAILKTTCRPTQVIELMHVIYKQTFINNINQTLNAKC